MPPSRRDGACQAPRPSSAPPLDAPRRVACLRVVDNAACPSSALMTTNRSVQRPASRSSATYGPLANGCPCFCRPRGASRVTKAATEVRRRPFVTLRDAIDGGGLGRDHEEAGHGATTPRPFHGDPGVTTPSTAACLAWNREPAWSAVSRSRPLGRQARPSPLLHASARIDRRRPED
jgi:hypothetical protein